MTGARATSARSAGIRRARRRPGRGPRPGRHPRRTLVRTELDGAFALGYLGDPPPRPEHGWPRATAWCGRPTAGSDSSTDQGRDDRRRGEHLVDRGRGRARAASAVAQAAVFPVPSQLAEDEVMAAVVVRPGHRVEPAELCRFAEPRLAYFALPRYIDVLDALRSREGQGAQGGVAETRHRAEHVGRGRGRDRSRPLTAPPTCRNR